MKPRAFFDKVSEMREAQKEYFKTRSSAALNRSKALEKEIDDEDHKRGCISIDTMERS